MQTRAKRSRLVASLMLMGVVTAGHAATLSLSTGTLAKIDAAAEAAVKQHRTAGVAVGIMSEGRMIFAKGYGSADLEHAIPATPDTVFRIGSLTKQFAAAGVLRLVEQGKLRLDDKLSQFYPDFPRSQQVTIRQLLTHTSGIHDYTSGPDYALISLRDYTTAEFVDVIARQPVLYDFEPGTAWSYSNSGYFLLGGIIEKVSGARLQKFFATEIFSRAGISHTAADSNSEIVAQRARGYERASAQSSELLNASYTSMTVPGAAGNLRSTVGDLAQWSHALFAGKVVTAVSLREMLSPAQLANGKLASTAIFVPPPPESGPAPAAPPFSGNFGFGLLVDTKSGQERVWHGGGINGFNSILETFPGLSLTIVVLTNTDGAAGELADSIVEAVLQQGAASS